jgi:Outer membrane protein beta-barrel family
MIKSFIILLFLFITSTSIFAQNPNKVTIIGSVADTTGDKLSLAYVMLLAPKDSTLINFTRGDEKGEFVFKNVKNQPYILKISYINYLPHSITIGPFEKEIADLGAIKIKPIAKELMEVVVRTARAPLTIRGDTIEYDARSFKVPEGSTVEDLLRKLPGLQVDADGNIKAQGKDVKKVLVDGKAFFGDDPKAATKNLGAETISKVQVYNDKSEQSKLTGIDDGKKEKAINLELKEEFKKGKFGKLTGAVGNESRWASKGNYNRFNKTSQFSVIGYGNNINETGVNWNDYGEFKGNSQFQNDNGDFGFNSTSGGRYFFSDGDGMNNFDGRGFTKNAGGGVNYNFDNKKTKFSSSYFYNQTKLNLNTIANRQTFQQNGSFFTRDTTSQNNFLGNHSLGMRYEKMIDSSNTIIAKTNLRIGANDKLNNSIQGLYPQENVLGNQLNLNNNYNGNSLRLSSTAIYRYKFKKNKARNFAASIGYNVNNNNNDEAIISVNKFYSAKNITDQIRATNLLNTTNLATDQIKGSLLYLEPLSKKMFWESFFNFSADNNTTFRNANNNLDGTKRVDSLSNFYKNNITYNRLGTSLRYSHDGKNFAIGLGAVNYNLTGNIFRDKNSPLLNSISKKYFGLTPNFESNLEMKNNLYLSFSYNYSINAPNLNDLQPVVNVSNPFYIVQGNPDLAPEKQHNFNINAYKFDPKSFAYINFNIGHSYYNSQIVYNSTINEKFVTITKPTNIADGNNTYVYFGGGIPVVKTKAMLNIYGNMSMSKSPSLINDVFNTTNNSNRSVTINLNLTPTPKFFMDLSTAIGVTNIKYTLQSGLNQHIINNSYTGSIKWNFAKKTFLESNFTNNIYKNEKLNFNRNMPIWNASIRRLFLKENKLEMRLAAFDLLNKRIGINQFGTQNYVYSEIAPTLARYYMLSLTYNMRGHEAKLRKNEGF